MAAESRRAQRPAGMTKPPEIGGFYVNLDADKKPPILAMCLNKSTGGESPNIQADSRQKSRWFFYVQRFYGRFALGGGNPCRFLYAGLST